MSLTVEALAKAIFDQPKTFIAGATKTSAMDKAKAIWPFIERHIAGQQGDIGIGVDVTADGVTVAVRVDDTLIHCKTYPLPQPPKPAGAVPLPEVAATVCLTPDGYAHGHMLDLQVQVKPMQTFAIGDRLCRYDDAIRYGDAREAAGRAVAVPDVVQELRALYKHHVNTLESARDKIIAAGGECDAVDVMEKRCPVLKRVRDVLESARIHQQPAAEEATAPSPPFMRGRYRELMRRHAEGCVVERAGREAVAWQYRDAKWKPGVWADITRAMYDGYKDGNATGKRGKDWDIRELYDSPTPAADAGGVTVTDAMDLARGAWRAGITLGNNICVQESDRENDQDGDSGWINGTSECAKRIREWADPEDAQLIELLNEAGVDTASLTSALAALTPEVGHGE